MSIGLGKSHGKAILIGEHAVVYNQPAIVVPLSTLKATAQIETNHQSKNNIDSNLYLKKEEILILEQIIEFLNERFSIKATFNLKISSNIPLNRGLGSSSAISSAIVIAYLDLFRIHLSDLEINELANYGDQFFHGSASGIDVTAANAPKPLLYSRLTKPKLLDFNFPGVLVIIDSGLQGKTKDAVKLVAKNIKTNPENKKLIDKIGFLTLQAQKFIEQQNIVELANTLNTSQEILVQLGVSIPIIDNLVEFTIENGALATKITGGGLGGCLISLCSDYKSASDLIKHFEALKIPNSQAFMHSFRSREKTRKL